MRDERAPSLVELAARVLREAEATAKPPLSGARDDEQREAHLALLAATIGEQRAQASRRRWTGAALAIAAVIVAAIGLRAATRQQLGPTAIAPRPETASPARYDVRVDARAMHVGDHVTAARTGIVVGVASGTKLTLDEGAELSVVEEGKTQIFALGAGNLRADVAKLHEGERFVVRTADTEVEVRGTSFRVEHVDAAASCRAEVHTRVVVSEGVVVVRNAGREDRVTAGEQWPLPCPRVADAGPSPSAPSAPPADPHPAQASSSSSSSSSSLAAANELFARAEAARKRGDHRGAVVLFDRLLGEHPSTPLSEPATVERMRALDKFDRTRAVAAARDYLARFPHGFARAEAEAIVAM